MNAAQVQTQLRGWTERHSSPDRQLDAIAVDTPWPDQPVGAKLALVRDGERTVGEWFAPTDDAGEIVWGRVEAEAVELLIPGSISGPDPDEDEEVPVA